jgi:hypothetical protein
VATRAFGPEIQTRGPFVECAPHKWRLIDPHIVGQMLIMFALEHVALSIAIGARHSRTRVI